MASRLKLSHNVGVHDARLYFTVNKAVRTLDSLLRNQNVTSPDRREILLDPARRLHVQQFASITPWP